MWKLLIVLAWIFNQSAIAFEGEVAAGLAKSGDCVACHNSDGNSSNPEWPNLAGQHPKYLIKQLLEFKLGDKGPRPNPIMLGMAEKLSQQDVLDLSAYFSSCSTKLGSVRQDLLELGEKIFRGGNVATGVAACASCHQMDGMGNSLAGFPRLSGQQMNYTMAQLKNFKEGKRKNDSNGMMRDIAKKMSDQEIEAVSSYVQGLH